MKKKTFAWAVLPIAALLAACGTPASSSSSGTSQSAQTSQSAEASQPAETSQHAGTSTTEGSIPATSEASSSEVIEHLDAYSSVSEGAELRKFDERFDTLVDDFSSATINGETDGVLHEGVLRALVDSNLDSFPKTTDGAIYKAASGTYEAMNFGSNGIGFKMRVSRGKLSLSNLRLELRGGDAFQTYHIQLKDAMNSDNEELPELTGEFQDILINPGQTIEDENTVYKNLDGTDSTTTVLGHILGFHLVANDEEMAGELEIAEVFTYAGTSRVVLDDFNREDHSKVPNAWWGGCASGFIVRRGATLNEGHHYTTPNLADHSFLVLSLLGDSTGTVLTGLDSQGTVLATLNWSEAKGNEALLPAIANGEYGSYVVDLAQLSGNGILAKVKISSTTPLEISNVFLTSLQVPQLDLSYPHISPSTVLDGFNDSIASLNNDWDASAALPANIEAGRNGFVAYALGDQISVSNGSLNLPATEGYAQVAIGYQETHLDRRAKYVVIAAKGEDLNLLRFKFRGQGSDSEVWFNAALAAEGVKSYGSQEIPSPYVDEEGFTHYVIDLALNGLGVGDIFDLYYTGSAPAQIGSIYFANDDMAIDQLGTVPPAEQAQGVIALSGYTYVGGISAEPGNLLGVKITSASGDADFASFRVQMGNETKWFNINEISAYDETGRRVLPTDKIPEEGCVVYFDLSVFSEDVEHYVHLHVGLENSLGTVEFSELMTYARGFYKTMGGGTPVEVDHTYMYLGGFPVDAAYEYILIMLSATGTNMTFESFRIACPDSSIAFINNGTLSAVHEDGTPVQATDVIPEDGGAILVDVSKSNLTLSKGETLHIHYAGWGDPVGTIQILGVAGLSNKTPYEAVVLPR